GDLAVEVVEEHPQRRLGLPRARVQLGSARRADAREVAAERLDDVSARGREAQGAFSSCLRIRSRHRHQLYPVAAMNTTTAATTPLTTLPPVATTTPKRIRAIPP